MRWIGFSKEKKAAAFLKKQGFTILKRNYMTKLGEIDIIAQKEKSLYFIEVRYRKTGSLVSPEESVDHRKIKKIINTAKTFIQKNNSIKYKSIYFSLIAMDNNEIRFIPNAFTLNEI